MPPSTRRSPVSGTEPSWPVTKRKSPVRTAWLYGALGGGGGAPGIIRNSSSFMSGILDDDRGRSACTPRTESRLGIPFSVQRFRHIRFDPDFCQSLSEVLAHVGVFLRIENGSATLIDSVDV